MDYGAIFLIGFLSSFGHCVGMCGGFVMAYTLKMHHSASEAVSTAEALLPHLFYNAGRVLTYTLLGGLFGLIGQILGARTGFHSYQAVLQLIAGALMVVIGLDMGGWIPPVFSQRFPGYNAFKRLVSRSLSRVHRGNLFGLGMILGLIPCGLVYAAGAKAAATGNAFQGMLTMLAFGLGTIPALFITGMTANLISLRLRSHLFRLATVLVILLGILTIYRGANALISPPLHSPMHQQHGNHFMF
ncbi:MAG: sulfite exporter TauE/SafE family protein [Calditrichaeota bacterium]|nr:MAG: sulfite exporter TauE/SafE family protein [Calditrichota bacterium]